MYRRPTGLAPKKELGASPENRVRGRQEHLGTTLMLYSHSESAFRQKDGARPNDRDNTIPFGRAGTGWRSTQAGAIDVLGAKVGLPHAISGHNSYWYWGMGSYDGEVLIMVGGDTEEETPFFESVERVGTTPDSKYTMPYERNRPILLCRKLKIPLREAWDRSKTLI